MHKSYARAIDDHAAYNVDLPATSCLFSRVIGSTGIVSHDLGALSEIDISTDPHQSLQLRRSSTSTPSPSHPVSGSTPAPAAAPSSAATAWTELNATPGHPLDNGAVDALAGDISSLQVQGVLGEQPKPEWQLDHPLVTLTLKASSPSSTNVTWVVAKPTSGDYYVLKSSAYPWFFQVNSDTGKALLDAESDLKALAGRSWQGACRSRAPETLESGPCEVTTSLARPQRGRPRVGQEPRVGGWA